ncbi:type II toxin-antitoxin system Phd/YefM family antitoxin [Marinomonas spartinae]|uniref:type II toxin-antitoxin system Phd/YefM family antitoxin n=1 Tax=Marinomonas spartinae TaxID=1792290 RepID=UPI0018F2504A|nr:type II toxin-antitoxin system Phd/YefM family antitoxin [Marinomonas spartinae]MBJ7556641.1 type II toxin-antitoxin system Phd/YefM family antitoxin [Marinomonas spartinae]
MELVTASALQTDLDTMMKKVCDSQTPIMIDRGNEPAVVMMSVDCFKALEEATTLFDNYANSKDILQNIANKDGDTD